MFHVKAGKKYVVSIWKNGKLSFKEVTCESEFTNFQIPQMEIETTDGEYYPLADVYKNKEDALKSEIKRQKQMIDFAKREIKEKEREIEENKKLIEESKKELKYLESLK